MSASKAATPQKKAPKKGKARLKKEALLLFDTESKDTEVVDNEKDRGSTKQATMSANKPTTPSKKSPTKSPKKARMKKEALFDTSSMDVVVPTALLAESTGGECSLLVQIDPQDSTRLDFEGQTGAIGRFEAEDNGGENLLATKEITVHNHAMMDLIVLHPL